LRDAKDFINISDKEEPPLTFAIRFNGQLCGVVGLVIQGDVYSNSAELGYWIGEEYWGKGVASGAVRLISAYGFDHLNLERIQAGVFESNIASMKVLLKNGYKKEGVFSKAVYKNNRYIDEYRFAKLSSW
jgi:RimJ/RimL family protein N-acetyltransferase